MHAHAHTHTHTYTHKLRACTHADTHRRARAYTHAYTHTHAHACPHAFAHNSITILYVQDAQGSERNLYKPQRSNKSFGAALTKSPLGALVGVRVGVLVGV